MHWIIAQTRNNSKGDIVVVAWSITQQLGHTVNPVSYANTQRLINVTNRPCLVPLVISSSSLNPVTNHATGWPVNNWNKRKNMCVCVRVCVCVCAQDGPSSIFTWPCPIIP